MSDQILRSKLIRLASDKPELRAHLLPLLKQAGWGDDAFVAFSQEFFALRPSLWDVLGATPANLKHQVSDTSILFHWHHPYGAIDTFVIGYNQSGQPFLDGFLLGNRVVKNFPHLGASKAELAQNIVDFVQRYVRSLATRRTASKSLEDQLHTFEMELSDFLNSPPKAKTLVDAVRQDIMPDNDQIQNSIVQNARKILKWKQNDKDMDELLKIWDEA